MNGARSSEHSNVASATLAMKSIVAVFSNTSPPVAGSPGASGGVQPGPAVTDVTTPRMFQVWVAGWPTLPSKSMARTEKVCGPTSVSSKAHSKAPCDMNVAPSKPHGS